MKPAQRGIGNEPPQIVKQMRPGKLGKAMPDRFAGSPGRLVHVAISNNFEILNCLRVDMNLDSGPPAEVFDLFHNAAFRAVAPVQEG